MITKAQKVKAVYNFTTMVTKDPAIAYFMGFIAGNIDRIHFVKDLTGAEIAVELSIGRTRIWPQEPFKAVVRNITMPNPLALVHSIINETTPVCICLNFEGVNETQWYQEVLLPDASYVVSPEHAAEEHLRVLWKAMDSTLDIYRECKDTLRQDPGRQEELQHYMNTAEEHLKVLSREIEEINRLVHGNHDNGPEVN